MTDGEHLEIPLEVLPGDQIFTHSDNDGVKRTFYTSAMARVAAKYGGQCEEILAARMQINAEVVQRIEKQMGVERARVDRLVEPYLSMPVIAIMWPDMVVAGDRVCTIVDGNHRIVKLAELGRTHYNCFVFTHPFWENFVADFVKEIGPHSGIIENERRMGCGTQSSLLSAGSPVLLARQAGRSCR